MAPATGPPFPRGQVVILIYSAGMRLAGLCHRNGVECAWFLADMFHHFMDAGLKRCGKSCRLRYTNYLRPNLKHENFTQEEEDLIVTLHSMLGSRCLCNLLSSITIQSSCHDCCPSLFWIS
jgi:hypothetical protein